MPLLDYVLQQQYMLQKSQLFNLIPSIESSA